MAGVRLFTLVAFISSIYISHTHSWKLKRANRLSNGIKYIIVDDMTGIQGIPHVWLSNVDAMANLDEAISKCNALGPEWEIAFMNSTETWEAISHAIEATEKLDDIFPRRQQRDSDPFWVGAEYDNDDQDRPSFLWKKTENHVRQSTNNSENYFGEIDDHDKFREEYDHKNNIKYGLVAYIPGHKIEIRYIPTEAREERRYMCTKTKEIESKPTPYESHLSRKKAKATKSN